MKRTIIAGSALALATTGLVLVPTAANAALETRCTGTAGAVVVPGDLLVPRDGSCRLEGTTVEGDVRVAPGGSLITFDAAFGGDVLVQADGYLDLTDTVVAGGVTNRGAYGVYLDGSTTASYASNAANPETFLSAYDADIAGAATVNGGSFLLEGATVGADTSVRNAYYADVLDTVLLGSYTVRAAEFGAVVCGSEIDGTASFRGNSFGVQLGETGPLGVCDQGDSYWGSHVDVTNTTGQVRVVGNIVRGDLSGTGNDPAPIASDNRVRGQILGQFADAAPAARMQAQSTVEGLTARDDVQERATERRDAAVQDALEAGPADL